MRDRYDPCYIIEGVNLAGDIRACYTKGFLRAQKVLYAYKRFCTRTKGFVCVQNSFVRVQKVLCAYKRLCKSTKILCMSTKPVGTEEH